MPRKQTAIDVYGIESGQHKLLLYISNCLCSNVSVDIKAGVCLQYIIRYSFYMTHIP